MRPIVCFVFLIVVVAGAVIVPLAPVIDCPLGIGPGNTGLEHLSCDVCKHTGKLTLLQAARWLRMNKGRWRYSC